jgi:hypothetical protein
MDRWDRGQAPRPDWMQWLCENVISPNSNQTLVWRIYYSFLNTLLHFTILWWDSTSCNVISPVKAPVKFSNISCHLFDDWLIVLCSYSRICLQCLLHVTTKDMSEAIHVKCEVLIAVTVMNTVIWDVALCMLVDHCRCFKWIWCLYLQGYTL